MRRRGCMSTTPSTQPSRCSGAPVLAPLGAVGVAAADDAVAAADAARALAALALPNAANSSFSVRPGGAAPLPRASAAAAAAGAAAVAVAAAGATATAAGASAGSAAPERNCGGGNASRSSGTNKAQAACTQPPAAG